MLQQWLRGLYGSWVVGPFRPAVRRTFRSGVVQRVWRSRAIPPHWRNALRLLRILGVDHGYLRSVSGRMPVDGDGRPIPWYTYPAIEFLRQLDLGGRAVFEYGSGNSTLFWAGVAGRVVSVEDDPEWYALMVPRVPGNVQLLLETDLRAFADVITRFDEKFDVIVIDGAARQHTRLGCARAAVSRLKPGGLIILDNSDWHPESSRLLREAGLLEVDMTGFAPINDYACTTSFYFHRDFDVPPRGDRQPMPGVGARLQNWEKGPMAERLAREREAGRREAAAGQVVSGK
jgi:hypothetical protein